MAEIKTDCFAFRKVRDIDACTLLRDETILCSKRECPFYKTREQFKADKEKYRTEAATSDTVNQEII